MNQCRKLIPETYGFEGNDFKKEIKENPGNYINAQISVIIAHRALCRKHNVQGTPDEYDLLYCKNSNSASSLFSEALSMASKCENPEKYAVPLEEMDLSITPKEENQIEKSKEFFRDNPTLTDKIPNNSEREEVINSHINPYNDGRLLLGCILNLMKQKNITPGYAIFYQEAA